MLSLRSRNHEGMESIVSRVFIISWALGMAHTLPLHTTECEKHEGHVISKESTVKSRVAFLTFKAR
jgi:hypothetical protein